MILFKSILLSFRAKQKKGYISELVSGGLLNHRGALLLKSTFDSVTLPWPASAGKPTYKAIHIVILWRRISTIVIFRDTLYYIARCWRRLFRNKPSENLFLSNHFWNKILLGWNLKFSKNLDLIYCINKRQTRCHSFLLCRLKSQKN